MDCLEEMSFLCFPDVIIATASFYNLPTAPSISASAAYVRMSKDKTYPEK